LRDIDLNIGWGEFIAIIGPSGCGKSTLLRLVGGLLKPSAGLVLVNGRDPEQAQRGKEVGFVFQDPALLPWRTVYGNVRISLEVNRNRRQAREPDELLEFVGLGQFNNYYPHQLSGGMQQRVALARALVFDPPLLLMDEPFGALDEITRATMRYELLRIWQATQKTVLFVTHSIAEAITLADRVVVLSSRPGEIRGVVPIDLPRPRTEAVEGEREFQEYAKQLREMLRE
jgi:NitT/TauT family transport system ATP-binding protein